MEELMTNYEQVYNFKQENSSNYDHDLSSLNNNYSVDENNIDSEPCWSQNRHALDMLVDFNVQSISQASNPTLSDECQKDVRNSLSNQREFWQKGNEELTIKHQTTKSVSEGQELENKSSALSFDLFEQDQQIEDIEVQSFAQEFEDIDLWVKSLTNAVPITHTPQATPEDFWVEDKKSTKFSTSEQDQDSDICATSQKVEVSTLSQESESKKYASHFSWSQHQAYHKALEGKVASAAIKGSSESEINLLSVRRSCFRALSAYYKNSFSNFNRAWQDKRRNKKKTKDMNEFVDTYIKQEFGSLLDNVKEGFFKELRSAVIAILHSHRYKKDEEFTRGIDFSVIRDCLYSYTLEARDRFVCDPAYALIYHNFFVCGGYKYLNSQVQCKSILHAIELENDLIALHKDAINTLQYYSQFLNLLKGFWGFGVLGFRVRVRVRV